MVRFSNIKILFLVSVLKDCGPINVLYNIILGLDQEKFGIFLISLSNGKNDQTHKKFSALNVKIIELNQSRLRGFIFNQKKIQEFVLSKKIDIVHSHGFRPDMINSKLHGVISFNTIHNFPAEDYQHRYGKIKGAILSAKHKDIIRGIQIPIACSETIKKKFKNNYDIETGAIKNGIDLNTYFPSEKTKLVMKQKLNFTKDQNSFIVSGALTKLKNPETIIKAFKLLNNANFSLVFIGSGELFNTLSRDYESEKIKFMGYVKEVQNYLTASDVYISASLTEGFPNSVLEAISTGLPVILSNIPVHREIVGDNYPYLFDPMNPSELAQKIEEIISPNNISRYKAHSLAIRQDFSAHAMSKKYAAAYIDSFNQVNK